MRDRLSEERIRRYIATTERALETLRIAPPPRSFARRLSEDFLRMARSYYEDAKHFEADGDLVNAFACVNYAHGWLDCGARIGLFDVGEDDQLFTLYD